MKNLVLHIGQHKTGSTSIQRMLAANRSLLRSRGVLYPEPSGINYTQHFISALVVQRDEIEPHILHGMGFDRDICIARAAEDWRRTREQAASNDISTVVLSTESLFKRSSVAGVARLQGLLSQITDDVRIFAYLRSPVQQYLSALQQDLKYRSNLRPMTGNLLLPIVEGYRAVFGRRFEYRMFERDRLLSGDATVDFLEWAGLEDGLDHAEVAESNVSLSAEAMAVLQRIMPAERPLSPEQRQVQVTRLRAVQAADAALPSPTKPRLRPEIVDHLTRVNTELSMLRDTYGLVFPDIDYALVGQPPRPMPAELQSVEQICDFDRDRRDALEARVNRKVQPKPLWHRALRRLAFR